MSLQSVSDLSNEIETIVDVDGNLWFKQTHVGKFLGLKHIDTSVEGLDKCEMFTRNAIRSGCKDQKNKWDIFLSRGGLLYVINICSKPTPNLINLAKCLRIELHKNKWL